MVAPPGFEPGSARPKPAMLDHYTTGLLRTAAGVQLALALQSEWDSSLQYLG